MSASARTVRKAAKKGTETTASHSVRTPNDTWARATARARREDLPINRVIIELLEGYSRGVYILPKRRVETVREYPQPTAPATVTAEAS